MSRCFRVSPWLLVPKLLAILVTFAAQVPAQENAKSRGRADLAERSDKLTKRLKSAEARQVVGRALTEATLAPATRAAAALLPPTRLNASEQQRLIDQSLMIVDTSVVDSAEARSGSWSFGHLMTEMAHQDASGIDPSRFTERWLSLWLADQRVNEFSPGATTVPKRFNMEALVLRPWREQSAGGKLDLSKAPFRLLAIVFRLDLRNNLVLGPAPSIGGAPAGELRLVYCVIDRQAQRQPFTINFEYNVEREDFAGVLEWAEQVYGLYENFPQIDSAAYRAELKRLTTLVTRRNANPEQTPNGSALAQIRTNENALNRVWELREFRLDGGNSGYLKEVTVKQTPELRFNRSARLGDFLKEKESDILGEMHAVPVEFQAEAFLAGAALNPSDEATPTQATLYWDAPGLKASLLEARHLFSLTTCNGCHGGETKTSAFLHIAPRDVGQRSELSGFLTGITVADPAGQMQGGGVKTRYFNDLQRRARDLKALLEYGEAYEMTRSAMPMVH